MTKIKNTLTSMVMATPLAVAATPMHSSTSGALPLQLSHAAGPVSYVAQAQQDCQWGAPISAVSSAGVNKPNSISFDIEGSLKQPKHLVQFATLIQRGGKWTWTQGT
jgi:hypothetical protein